MTITYYDKNEITTTLQENMNGYYKIVAVHAYLLHCQEPISDVKDIAAMYVIRKARAEVVAELPYMTNDTWDYVDTIYDKYSMLGKLQYELKVLKEKYESRS